MVQEPRSLALIPSRRASRLGPLLTTCEVLLCSDPLAYLRETGANLAITADWKSREELLHACRSADCGSTESRLTVSQKVFAELCPVDFSQPNADLYRPQFLWQVKPRAWRTTLQPRRQWSKFFSKYSLSLLVYLFISHAVLTVV